MAFTTRASPPVPASLATTSITAKVEHRVLDFIRRSGILNAGEGVIVAVSGGPDSSALLVALSRLRSALDFKLAVAHYNHMLRPAGDTAADLEFVRALASSLEIPFAHEAAEVRAHSKHQSLEDGARRLRYAFLAEAATEAGASVVVTGHTLDDQAETVLLHLIRGAGLDGVAGMRPRSPWPFGVGPDLSRPLLSLRRKDTEEYCRELGLTARKDPTNELPVATRNRVRRDIMPLLRSLNPNVDEAIGRFATAAAHDADYLDALAKHHFARIASLGPQAVSFARADLLIAAPALSTRLFRLAFAHVTGTAADLEAAHIDALVDALQGPPVKLSLPGGITAVMDSRSAVVRCGETTPAKRIPQTRLAVPGRTDIGGCVFKANIVPAPAELPRMNAGEAFLDAESAGAELNVRSRRPGDRLRPLGLGGEKKLQDILVDAKVPALERDEVPIVSGPRGIVWVVGHCIDETYALRSASQRALHILVQPAPVR